MVLGELSGPGPERTVAQKNLSRIHYHHHQKGDGGDGTPWGPRLPPRRVTDWDFPSLTTGLGVRDPEVTGERGPYRDTSRTQTFRWVYPGTERVRTKYVDRRPSSKGLTRVVSVDTVNEHLLKSTLGPTGFDKSPLNTLSLTRTLKPIFLGSFPTYPGTFQQRSGPKSPKTWGPDSDSVGRTTRDPAR